MDDADIAQEAAERVAELERKHARAPGRSQSGLQPCSACHFCSETISDSRLFCDADCRDDYERIKRAEVRNGRVVYADDPPD